MSHFIAKRAQQLKSSPTIAVSDLARSLKVQGHDVISLSAGEPDFDTPEFAKNAAISAIHNSFTKYTNVDGFQELKLAIIEKFKRDNNLKYSTKEIIASSGAKHSIYNALLATLNKGDEVIIPAPYWVSYPSMVELAEGIPIIVKAGIKDSYKITPQHLEKALTPKTRMVIINTPSNPTGMAYSLNELKALGEVLLKHPNVLILTDDIYEFILWGQEKFANILNACPELHPRTLVVNGVSKAYAMTGWRIGFTAGPEEIIQAMKKIQSQSTSNPCSISQAAAAEALKHGASELQYMVEVYHQRHNFMLQGLNQLAGVRCTPADGAFYLFPDVSEAMKTLGFKSDIKLATALLDEVKVAVVPGSGFGSPGNIRLSCATSSEKLEESLIRLKRFFG